MDGDHSLGRNDKWVETAHSVETTLHRVIPTEAAKQSPFVIPTEDLKGPSGGICGVGGQQRAPALSMDSSARSFHSLGRNDTEKDAARSVGITKGGSLGRSVGRNSRARWVASACSPGFLSPFHVEAPLQGSLTDLPGTIADDPVEQYASVMLASVAL